MSQRSQNQCKSNSTQSVEADNLDDSLDDFKIQPRKLRKIRSSQNSSKSQSKSVALTNKNLDSDSSKKSQSTSSRNINKKETLVQVQLSQAVDIKCNALPLDEKDKLVGKNFLKNVEFVEKPISISGEREIFKCQTLIKETSVNESRTKPTSNVSNNKSQKTIDKCSVSKNLQPCQDYARIRAAAESSVDLSKPVSSQANERNRSESVEKTMSPEEEFTKEKTLTKLNVKEVDPCPQEPSICPICDKTVNDLQNHIKTCCLNKFSFSKKNVPENGIICGIQYDEASASKKEVQRETCSRCNEDITHMSKKRRIQHVNRCGEEIPTVEEMMSFPCPFCGVDHPTSEGRTTHLKQCGKKLNLKPEKLLAAAQLTARHEAERKALGLPNLPKPKPKPVKKKKNVFQINLPKDQEEAELQMAMALSASLQEEQVAENSAPEISPSESDNPAADQARFSSLFTGATLPIPKAKGRKKKPEKIYKLALQTDEERSKQLQYKVSELLEGQFTLTPSKVFNWHRTPIKCKLWLISGLKGDLSRNDFYIEDFVEREDANKMSISFRPKHLHLSQIAGRQSLASSESRIDFDESSRVIIGTPQLTQCQNQQPCDDNLGGFLSQKCETITAQRKISSDYSKIVGKKDFSDATITMKDGQIPIHRIIISVRCPKLLEEFSTNDNLDLKEYNHSTVLRFLEFVYSGECDFDDSMLEDLKNLAVRFEQNDLLDILNKNKSSKDSFAEENENSVYQLADQTLHNIIHSVWKEPNTSSSKDKSSKLFKPSSSTNWDDVLNLDVVLSLSRFITQDNNEGKAEDSREVSESSNEDDDGDSSVFLPDREESGELSDGNHGSDNVFGQPDGGTVLICQKSVASLPKTTNSDTLPVQKNSNSFLNCEDVTSSSNQHANRVLIINSESSDLPEINIANNVNSRDDPVAVVDLRDSDKSHKQSDKVSNQEENPQISPKPVDKDDHKFHFGDTILLNQEIDRNSPAIISINSSSSNDNLYNNNCERDNSSLDANYLSVVSPDGSFLLKSLHEKTIEILNTSDDLPKDCNSVSAEKTIVENLVSNDVTTPKPVKIESNMSFMDRVRNGLFTVVDNSPVDDFPDCTAYKSDKKRSPKSPVKKFSPKGKNLMASPTSGVWLNKKSTETSPTKPSNSKTPSKIDSISSESPKSSLTTGDGKKILFPEEHIKQIEERKRCLSPDIFASDSECEDEIEPPCFNISIESVKFESQNSSPRNSPECVELSSQETPLPLAERLRRNALQVSTDNKIISTECNKSNTRIKRHLVLTPENKKRSKPDNNEAEKSSNFSDLPDVDNLSPFSEENEIISSSPKTLSLPENVDDTPNKRNSKLNTKRKISLTQPEPSKRKNCNHIPSSQPIKKKNKQTPPVTPMPDYKTMVTPELKDALKKFGVKALPRSKAVPILTHIYDATHPYVSDSDGSPSTSQMPPPKKGKSPTKNVVEDSSSDISSSQGSNSSSGGTEMLEESTIEESQVIDDLDYKRKLKLFIESDPELHMQILTYKPIPLKELHASLKLNGIKLTMPTLMNFLDEQCITFTLPRSEKQREKQQRRQKRFRERVRSKLKQ